MARLNCLKCRIERLIEPDGRMSRIRLSEKVSRSRPRKAGGPFGKTDQTKLLIHISQVSVNERLPLSNPRAESVWHSSKHGLTSSYRDCAVCALAGNKIVKPPAMGLRQDRNHLGSSQFVTISLIAGLRMFRFLREINGGSRWDCV